MNVPYNEINLSDAAKRININYSTLARYCQHGLINVVNVSGGGNKARYLLEEKEVEYLRSLRKSNGKHFMKFYSKDWDVSKEPEPCDIPDEFEMTQVPLSLNEEPKIEITDVVEDDLPAKKAINIDSITTTISYMKDINDRLSQIEKEKLVLLEKLNDIEAEKNQLENEYSELKDEVVGAL